MRIEQVTTRDALHEFLTGTCNFKVKAGFDPVSKEGGRSVYTVNDGDDTLDVIMTDDAISGEMNEFLKELTIEAPVEQYQLIVQGDFQKLAMQRAKAPQSWGIKSRYRIVYDSSSDKEDTKASILAKFNGLRYANDSAFNNFFDVKEIVDKFYSEYDDFRTKLRDGMVFPASLDIDDDDRDEYATIIMNRIVFTYFIQIPGKGASIIPEHFLQDLYAKYRESKKTPSFYLCLCKLWFEYFNSDKERTVEDGMFKDIPYLNGGLFSYVDGIEIDGISITYKNIVVPDDIWDGLFGVFESYEWTVVENDADDELLGITPSILGHIYEKQCNQKETGSYYTPDTITNYISKECISKHVTEQVNKKFKKTYGNFVDEVIGKEKLTREEIGELDWAYNNVITTITICDNACGSGAFLIAAEKILVDIYQKCLEWLDGGDIEEGIPARGNDIYEIKRYIVTNNIFGVDIQEGSVEIAKLRLWLSMISSMQGGHVEPLPNIDYNILDGNSLIGYVKMPTQWGDSLLSDPSILNELLERNKKAKQAYKIERSASKSFALRQEIDDTNEQIRAELDSLYLKKLNANKGISLTKDQLDSLHPFHWCFEFQGVFEKGGFDVVIGNPPYVRQERFKEIKPLLSSIYTVYNGNSDLSLYFVERSLSLLKKYGIHSYIITNKWFRAGYGKKTRELLKNNVFIEEIIDFNDVKVFRGINVDTAIYMVKKIKKMNDGITTLKASSVNSINSEEKVLKKQIELDDEIWNFITGAMKDIHDYVTEQSVPFSNIGNKINFGIKTGYNPAFLINTSEAMKLRSNNANKSHVLPLIRGKDIKRYSINWSGSWIILFKNGETRNLMKKKGVSDISPEDFLKNDFPLIYNHFQSFKNKKSKRGKGLLLRDDQGEFYWELRSCSYYNEFSLPKITWARITKEPYFSIDNGIFFIHDSMAFFTSKKSLKTLQVIFASKLIKNYYVDNFVHQYSDSGYLLSNQYVDRFPIILPDDESTFMILCDYLLFSSQEGTDHSGFLINIGNYLTYDLYLHEKFVEKELIRKNDRIELLISRYLQPIDYDDWSRLYWKEKLEGTITSAEKKKKQNLENEIKNIIINAVNNLKEDKELEEIMKKMAKHPWVQIIEKETNVD